MKAKHDPSKCSVCEAQRKRFITVIADIKAKLDSIEEYMAWLIPAEKRFWVGQRVELSQRARRRGLFAKTRLDRKGTVKRIESFSIVVQLDGYKHPRAIHHAFFNPVSGPKLF